MYAQGCSSCLCVTLMQLQHEDPYAYTHVPIMSNFFPKDTPVCAYVQILFENGNLMVIVMNVDLADQKTGERKSERSCEKERFV